MADRTFYRLAIRVNTPREALLAAAEAFTGDSWTLDDVDQLTAGEVDGVAWIDIQERCCGESREAADAVLEALTDHGQSIAFTVTEDPKYEWLGTMCRYDPARGMHEVECDSNARALLVDSTLTRLCGQSEDPAQILDQIRAILGLDWDIPPGS